MGPIIVLIAQGFVSSVVDFAAFILLSHECSNMFKLKNIRHWVDPLYLIIHHPWTSSSSCCHLKLSASPTRLFRLYIKPFKEISDSCIIQ